MMTTQTICPQEQTGFTLVEMAMVLLIVALLLGGLLPTISSQVDQRHNTETNAKLDEIRQALIGFAVINGRLPCPATTTSNGLESMAGVSCSNPYDGFVPAATLGLSGADSSGLLEDAWGNPIHYAVTAWNNAFTTANGIKNAGISNLSPDLLVCSTATGISGTSCNGSGLTATPGVPIVIFSTGKNGAQGSAGVDEAANLDANRTFVSHTPSASGAPNGEYDDLMTWISTNTLLNRMVSAGKLP